MAENENVDPGVQAAIDAGTLQVGRRYYFVEHAYYHYIGEVVAITGRRECILRHVRRIHSCQRNWTHFFKDGARNDTEFTVQPDGKNISGWMEHTPWPHAIPGGPA